MTVVDSSVVVEVLTGRLAATDLGIDPLAVPHLIDSEVVNSLRGLWLGGYLVEGDATRALDAFDELAIARYPTARLQERVWELRHNLTPYDAAYVALAERLGETLLTKDSGIAGAPGLRCTVEVL